MAVRALLRQRCVEAQYCTSWAITAAITTIRGATTSWRSVWRSDAAWAHNVGHRDRFAGLRAPLRECVTAMVRVGGFAPAAILLAATAALTCRRSEPSGLSHRARSAMHGGLAVAYDFAGLPGPKYGAWWPAGPVGWLSPQRIIYDSWRRPGLVALDIDTGKARRLAPTGLANNRDRRGTWVGPGPIPVDAGGKTSAILCSCSLPGRDGNFATVLYVISAAGKVLGRRHSSEYLYAFAAGKGWLGAELSGRNKRFGFYLSDARCASIEPVRTNLRPSRAWPPPPNLQALASDTAGTIRYAVVTSPRRFTAAQWSVAVLRGGALNAGEARYSANLPAGFTGIDAAVRPDGNGVAVLARRVLPPTSGPLVSPPTEISLWTGTAPRWVLREVGTVLYAQNTLNTDIPSRTWWPENLSWAPDGVSVAFTAKDELWVCRPE